MSFKKNKFPVFDNWTFLGYSDIVFSEIARTDHAILYFTQYQTVPN